MSLLDLTTGGPYFLNLHSDTKYIGDGMGYAVCGTYFEYS